MPKQRQVPPIKIVLEPVPFGPRIADDVRDDGPWTAEHLRQRIPDNDLKACYRWARTREPDLEASLVAEIRVDEWGGVESAKVTADSARTRPVAACVQDVLFNMDAGRTAGRPVDLRMQIRLMRGGLGRPAVARPKRLPAVAPPPGLCVVGGAPVATIEFHEAIVIASRGVVPAYPGRVASTA